MLVEELEAFLDSIAHFEKLGVTCAENARKLKDYRKKQEQTQSSVKKSYGLFGSTTKEDKLKSLDEKIGKLELTLTLEKKLFAIAAHVIRIHEIDVIKARKRARFEEILREFASTRLKKLEKESEFWGKLLESEEGYEYSTSELNAYLNTQKPEPAPANQEQQEKK